ncbi:phosphoribosylaminoimidazole carboxylase ATPase subunit [Scardovia inopinata]|uniref:N5-carboxyaminoimidazole ribonucleotide synthase n=1 Tax=Scardovia inopinata F0304 TaxID=641146 RepID=W5IK98_SCAIO|nr:5-(carboxyamino)imidazole ribonucleotide synthase [Scardovia inopinata]EFG27369.1 phosphoribosylaminoimidazole carboxylase, ATPase subunit [Scardovia inopinata F0304]BAR06981.1 phosphoribosylaminoimidazole carboxylase ATPase subunit [Scardovia inopinata JCM 12537]SUV51048.1 phosphoribosylaminoimidazole carboxylase ATPase subunit [Scardovia inopinata]
MPSLYDATGGKIRSLGRGATIGIVGGGQLGRMMALSARYMGLRIGVLDPTDHCPTGQVADFQIVADYNDQAAIRQLAQRSDVLTYEFENVDADALDQVSDCVPIPQGTNLLRITQNRVHEKSFINNLGIETAPWLPVNSRQDLDQALQKIGFPAVLKTASGGYDGHGQIVLKSPEDCQKVWPADKWPQAIVEAFVDFDYEASILVSGNGKHYVTFPLVRNEHRHNILHMTLAPASVSPSLEKKAKELALALADGFQLSGTLAIELFITKDQRILVNELAPRPHNSGHYTIEACSVSQYDTHIRGIIGWDLPQPRLLSPAVMVNILGQHVDLTQKIAPLHPGWNLHDYGKAEVKHNRKMGHITVLTDNPQQTAKDLMATGCWDDVDR